MKRTLLTTFSVLLTVSGAALAAGKAEPAPATSVDSLISMNPAEVDTANLQLGTVEQLHETGTPQVVTDIAAWRLEVRGDALANPLSLSYSELAAMPMVKKRVLLICPGFFADYVEWEGVPVSALLEKAKAHDTYGEVVFTSWDGYPGRFKREEVDSNLLFLALQVNGQPLPAAHGFPIRLVAEHLYGGRWVKWVTEMRVD